MNKKIRKENLKTVVVLALLSVAAIIAIEVVNRKASAEINKEYATKAPLPEENARKYVPVEYTQFVSLVESFHNNHSDVLNIGAFYASEDNFTCFPISRGQELLTGKNTATEWCSDTLCSFATQNVNDSIVVVSCPADLMARLVEDYENSHNAN